MISKDRVTGGIIFLVAIGYLYMTAILKSVSISGDTGPKFFPYIAGIGLALCGIAIFVRNIEKKSKEAFFDSAGFKRMLLVSAALILYTLLLRPLGFIIASSILLFAVLFIYDKDKKVSLLKRIFFTAIIVAFIYISFSRFLSIRFPAGTWLAWIY